MRFSVCIPVYNTSQYLDECLQSVLNQTEKDYEIVLVDDGSTDDSGKICDRYAALYPHVQVIHKENEGLLMTRRRGFQEAKGDYFLCLDSDDAFCDENALKKIRTAIEDNQADLALFEYICASEQKLQPDRRISLFSHKNGIVFSENTKQELYQKLLLGKSLNPIVIKVISRRILDLETDYSRWKEQLVNSQGEDLFQSLPVLDSAKRIVYINEPLYFYRWNPQSISRNVRPDYYYAYRTVYQRTDEYLDKWGFTEDEIHRIMQQRINMIFGVLLAEFHPDRKKWLQVIGEVSEDPFFHGLWEKRDSQYVCKYYLLMGRLILKKKLVVLQIVKKVVDFLMKMKKLLEKGK